MARTTGSKSNKKNGKGSKSAKSSKMEKFDGTITFTKKELASLTSGYVAGSASKKVHKLAKKYGIASLNPSSTTVATGNMNDATDDQRITTNTGTI